MSSSHIRPPAPGMASDSFVSFPRFDELVVEESLADKLTGKLQRLWAAATPSSTNNPPPAAPIYSPQLSTAHSNSYLSDYAQEPALAAPSSRQTSASQPPLLPSELSTRPSGAVPITSGAKLPTRQFVRPIRVSGVSPSILLTIANSEKGIQAPGPRSHVSDYRFAGDGFLGGGVHGSPTASESFANLAQLTSIPGFALDRIEGVDDSKSIRSVGSFARPSASVAHIFRRMRGEVSRGRHEDGAGLMHLSGRRDSPRTTGSVTSYPRSALIARRCLLRSGGSIIVSSKSKWTSSHCD